MACSTVAAAVGVMLLFAGVDARDPDLPQALENTTTLLLGTPLNPEPTTLPLVDGPVVNGVSLAGTFCGALPAS